MGRHFAEPSRRVEVTNMPGSTGGFFTIVKRQYDGLRDDLEEKEVLVMLYHSPAGEQIHVETVFLNREADTMIFQGWDSDNNFCQVVTQAHGVQLLLKTIRLDEPPDDRKPIGFRVVD